MLNITDFYTDIENVFNDAVMEQERILELGESMTPEDELRLKMSKAVEAHAYKSLESISEFFGMCEELGLE